MARGQVSVDAALSMAKTASAPAGRDSVAWSGPEAALQAQWSLLLDGDLRDVVVTGLAAKLAAVAVNHNVCVWSSDGGSAPECTGVEIHVTGEARGVAEAKVAIADALVATCTSDFEAPVMKEAPAAPTSPYPAAAYADWGQAATPWAPWTAAVPAQCSPAAPLAVAQPSALVAQPFMDYNSYGMTSQEAMFSGFHPGGSADMQLVHFTQQIPHSLVGLVIGVKGASIHAVELASQCHLSLDRGCVFTDPDTGVPYVLLHIHGMRAGAMQAIAMTAQILQRHVSAMHAAPSCLAIDPADRAIEPAMEQPLFQADSETVRQDVTRALFADPVERDAPPPSIATPLPLLPSSLSPPQTAPKTPGSAARQPNRRRRLSAPSPADSPLYTPL